MNYRTVVDMDNKNALITKAMLASYINEKQMDYLGMLEPFIIKSLPSAVNSAIDIENITKQIDTDFGINIKQKIVEKILIRLSKEKKGKLVRKESRRSGYIRDTLSVKIYYVNKEINNDEFDRKKNKMESLVSEIVSKLRQFYEENYNTITYEDAEKYLINFLEDYNDKLYSNVDNLRSIQITEKHNSINFRVAKFILSEYNNKANGCYNKIKEIQAGYFASVAIYYFCKVESENKNPTKIIDNTHIILDTRILIDVLGLNRISESKSMNELVTLINENGGKLCTFDYYIDELDGIIKKFLSDKTARASLDLDYFRREKLSNVEIALYRENLEKEISEKGITIIRENDYSELINEKTWHIDPSELKSNMRKLIDYQYVEGNPAFENDFNSLQAIAYYKYCQEKQGGKKYIFITSNSGIVQTAHYTFKDKIYHTGLDIVMSDIDLTATLWLSNFNPKSDLPDLVLLENAYAAICPTKDILNKVLEIIDKNIESSNERIKNDALLLRYSDHILEDIAEITKNDIETIDDGIFNKLTNHQENRIYDKLLAREENKIEKKYEKRYQNKLQNLEDREDDIKQKEEDYNLKITNITETLEETTETLKNTESELEKVKNDNENIKSRDVQIIKNEYDKIKHRAEKISKISYKILVTIISFFILYILYVACKTGTDALAERIKDFKNVKLTDLSNIIITVIGTFLTFVPVEIFFIKKFKKTSNKLYDFVYRIFCKRSSILNAFEENKDT